MMNTASLRADEYRITTRGSPSYRQEKESKPRENRVMLAALIGPR
jgi:hypothetical protein